MNRTVFQAYDYGDCLRQLTILCGRSQISIGFFFNNFASTSPARRWFSHLHTAVDPSQPPGWTQLSWRTSFANTFERNQWLTVKKVHLSKSNDSISDIRDLFSCRSVFIRRPRVKKVSPVKVCLLLLALNQQSSRSWSSQDCGQASSSSLRLYGTVKLIPLMWTLYGVSTEFPPPRG